MTENLIPQTTDPEALAAVGLTPEVLERVFDEEKVPAAIIHPMLRIPKEQRGRDVWDILEAVHAKRLEVSYTEPTLESIVGIIKNTSAAAAGDIADVYKSKIPGYAVDISTSVSQWAAGKLKPHVESLVQLARDLNLIPETMEETIENAVASGHLMPLLSVMLMTYWTFIQSIGGFASAQVKFIQRQVNENLRPDIPPFTDFLKQALFDRNTLSRVQYLMGQQGIPEEYLSDYLRAAKTYLGVEEVFELLFRDHIDEEKAVDLLERAGFTGEERELILDLRERLPNIQDVIRFAVRETIDLDIGRSLGLLDEFPAAFAAEARKRGLSEENALRYWGAHWELPSVTLGFEMLHRGIISQEQMSELLKIQDYPQVWRDRMIQVAFSPYTRVDIRRMYALGVLNREDVFRAYQDIGYDEEKASKLTDFTIRLNMEEEFNLSKGQVLEAYRDRIIDEREAVEMLEGLGFTRDEIEIILAIEQFKEAQQIRKIRIGSVERLYKLGAIDTIGVAERLGKLNVSGEKQSALIEEWDVERLLARKKPSLAELKKWFKNEIIPEAEFRDELHQQGWIEKYIDRYVQEVVETEEA